MTESQRGAPGPLPPSEPRTATTRPMFREAFRFWLKLGFINFGGPAGQIAIMHKELVEQRRWVSESVFLHGLNFATILPGPEAMQLATYLGRRLHGTTGGIVAGLFFFLPAVSLLLLLSWLAVAHKDVTVVEGALYGVQPVVIAIVAEAVIRIGRRALRPRGLVGFALAAFLALYLLHIPFPAVVAAAALLGLAIQRFWPRLLARSGGAHAAAADQEDQASQTPPTLRRNLGLIALWLALTGIPFLAIWLWQGRGTTLFQETRFFTWAAFVTFGGAYAVLSLVADQAVNVYGWLTGPQMVQGLALAESTPGPLIMVLQYVGFLGAYNHPGALSPWAAGTAGALTTTYVTFVPSFMFIFLGAPYIDLLAGNKRIAAALTAVTAAIVGVIANLGVFFATKVVTPESKGFDWFAAVVATTAFVAVVRFKLPIHVLIVAGVALGIIKVFIARALA
ncbi:MAG: chromate efflux transporter [Dehalococcoidia bacterium]|nr:chromate efflux transporter [Dehalococcoidia bacterium]